ncbi:hypothetical protein [Streptomyces sp. MAR4 CNX-425]|uniref:hypothetical protein n=1 Tax=Streptomyces sp. MAR4 CNX-425 TaxID=3406343 RepID=UPI003B503CFE
MKNLPVRGGKSRQGPGERAAGTHDRYDAFAVPPARERGAGQDPAASARPGGGYGGGDCLHGYRRARPHERVTAHDVRPRGRLDAASTGRGGRN